MKRLPVDVSNFRLMIEANYIYVDKTEIIYNLITKRRLYFLSRPRRFGKSLLLSTLKELFSGSQELFKETWIGQQSSYVFSQHPVIHLDFSAFNAMTPQSFEADLIWALEKIAAHYAISISNAPSFTTKVEYLIEQLSQKNKVVILIDEYDSALLRNLQEKTKTQELQKIMQLFFSTLKSCDALGYLQFLFITGVTKFAKTSIFSGLNNLTDITLNPEAATLLGYTKDEINTHFNEYLELFAQKKNCSTADIHNQIQTTYNGYRFSSESKKVYNPFSVAHCFDNQRFMNFWFETGTPSFLVPLIQNQYTYLENITTLHINETFLGTFELSNDLPLIPVLFQTGYLTITDYNETDATYQLNWPNSEVQEAFKKYLVLSLSYNPTYVLEGSLPHFKAAIESNNIDLFCTTLSSFLANIPYQLHIGKESYYHSLLHVLLDLLGYKAQSEISSSKGRIDLVLKTPTTILIFEFKFQSTAQRAVDQIMEKTYYEKYLLQNKPIILIGISFNVKNKKLVLDWVYRPLQ